MLVTERCRLSELRRELWLARNAALVKLGHRRSLVFLLSQIELKCSFVALLTSGTSSLSTSLSLYFEGLDHLSRYFRYALVAFS